MNNIDSAKPAIGQTSNNGSLEPFHNPKIKRAIHISPTKPHHPNTTFPSPLNTSHTQYQFTNMPFFPTYDITSNSIILTTYDHINHTFFDPITDKNYDYPFVFKNDIDLQLNLPHLLTSLLHNLTSQQHLINQNITNISSLLIQLHSPNKPIFFIHIPSSNTNIPFIYNNNIPFNPLTNNTIPTNNTISNIPINTPINIPIKKQFNTFTFKPS